MQNCEYGCNNTNKWDMKEENLGFYITNALFLIEYQLHNAITNIWKTIRIQEHKLEYIKFVKV